MPYGHLPIQVLVENDGFSVPSAMTGLEIEPAWFPPPHGRRRKPAGKIPEKGGMTPAGKPIIAVVGRPPTWANPPCLTN